MNRFALRIAAHPWYPSFNTGIGLGALAAAMLALGGGRVVVLLLAIVMVVAGGASCVCFHLVHRCFPSARERRKAVRSWTVAIGLGVVVGMAAVDAALLT